MSRKPKNIIIRNDKEEIIIKRDEAKRGKNEMKNKMKEKSVVHANKFETGL